MYSRTSNFRNPSAHLMGSLFPASSYLMMFLSQLLGVMTVSSSIGGLRQLRDALQKILLRSVLSAPPHRASVTFALRSSRLSGCVFLVFPCRTRKEFLPTRYRPLLVGSWFGLCRKQFSARRRCLRIASVPAHHARPVSALLQSVGRSPPAHAHLHAICFSRSTLHSTHSPSAGEASQDFGASRQDFPCVILPLSLPAFSLDNVRLRSLSSDFCRRSCRRTLTAHESPTSCNHFSRCLYCRLVPQFSIILVITVAPSPHTSVEKTLSFE